MIVVKITGGLGNQMFQYAFGKILASKNNDVLALDISGYARGEGITKREYGLNIFGITDQIATTEDIRDKKIIKETSPKFDKAFSELGGDLYLDGYWQNFKYFEGFEDVVRNYFKLNKPLGPLAQEVLEKIRSGGDTAISMQIRRGDYVKNKRVAKEHGALSADFFKRSVNLVADKISHNIKDPKVFVFSEELGWFFKFQLRTKFDTKYVSRSGIKDYEEIYLMSQCRHHIISNSTFGWWGAWLDPRPDKIVVAPEKYFRAENMVGPDLIPPDWITIPR